MAKKAPGKKSGAELDELTCFVVIGFGRKTDFRTGRVLDLDLTYSKLIAPACAKVEKAKINVFRAIDVNKSGSIDRIMYHWLYHADLIIADLSTQNSNVMYELGVRHAQKPHTSIMMSEEGIFSAMPFDLSHAVVHAYKHLGDEISDDEAGRFTTHLAQIIDDIIDLGDKHMDSPVFTYMEGMEPPVFLAPADRIAQLEAAMREAGQEVDEADLSKQAVSILVQKAENAKDNKEFGKAIMLLDMAIEQMEAPPIDPETGEELPQPEGGPPKEVYLYQRKALSTYKRSEKNPKDDEAQNQAAIADLHAAEAILSSVDNPLKSNDPETLGLSGAINKRLFQRTRDQEYMDLSIRHYERGFYIAQDYYNGINVAFMYTWKADLTEDDFDATVNYGHALLLRKRVAAVCEALIDSDSFNERGDKQWVYMTLAEAYLGSYQEDKAEKLMPKIAALSKGEFDMDTFKSQQAELLGFMRRFDARRGAAAGIPAGEAVDAETLVDEATGQARAAAAASGADPVVTGDPSLSRRPQVRPPGAIVIDLGTDQLPRSVELKAKVEF